MRRKPSPAYEDDHEHSHGNITSYFVCAAAIRRLLREPPKKHMHLLHKTPQRIKFYRKDTGMCYNGSYNGLQRLHHKTKTCPGYNLLQDTRRSTQKNVNILLCQEILHAHQVKVNATQRRYLFSQAILHTKRTPTQHNVKIVFSRNTTNQQNINATQRK